MGPLHDIRVIELAGIGPTPFAGMMLADMGAEVIRVDRVGGSDNPVATSSGPMERGKRSIAVDLKQADGVGVLLGLVETADVLIEGFRAGVAERLGVGPSACHERNPRLVYGRMTGWGQDGPLAQTAGHDINYISLAGPLAHIGRVGQAPAVPLNLVGDFGGGSVFLVLGVCAALLEVARGGEGQVVDAAMVDGASYLMSPLYTAHANGYWTDERGTNLLDSGAPLLRRVRDRRRPVDGRRGHRAQVLRRPARRAGPRGGGPARSDGAGPVAGDDRALRLGVRDQNPGRVGRGLRRPRRVRHAGADHG